VISPDDETPEIVEESLEDTIRNAMTAANEEPTAADETQVADAAPIVDESPSRDRDERGQFKKKADTPLDAAPSGDQEAAAPKPEEEGVRPDPYGLAPQYAGPAIKAKWNTLDPEVREEITKRDREVHQQFTRFDEERNFGKQIKTMVQPYEGLIRSMGAEPTQAIDYLLKTDYMLRTAAPDQKRAMFMKAAQDYGINLGEPGEAPQQQPASNPGFESAIQRIERLERELNNASNAARETEQAEIASSIEAFAADPAHVYFDRVRPMMGTLMANGHAGSLQEAYDQAVMANVETRALHLAALRETEDRKRTDATRLQAEKARRASPSVTGAPGSAVLPLANGSASNSVEDDVRLAIQSVAGRA
jgi:hypothetical protein